MLKQVQHDEIGVGEALLDIRIVNFGVKSCPRRFRLRFVALALLAMTGGTGAAIAQTPATGTPTVGLYTISDLDDPAMIRPVQPVEGYEQWLTPADFPADAFDPAQQRYFQISLVVDANDTITACQPLVVPSDLGARVCEVIAARGRFVHALDASGTAQSGTRAMGVLLSVVQPGLRGGLSPAPPPMGYQNTKAVLRDAAVLQLAADPQRFIAPAPSLWADISAKGRVTRCRIRTSTGTDAGDTEICRRMSKAKFDPARDPQGNKVPAMDVYFAFKVGPQG